MSKVNYKALILTILMTSGLGWGYPSAGVKSLETNIEDSVVSRDRFAVHSDLDAIVSQISPDSIEAYAHVLESYPPRTIGSAASAQSREWLMAKLEDYGYTPVLDTFSYSEVSGHNIMAYHEGINYPNIYIIIGAHYDAVPGSPGAHDNGSGISGVLEIARLMVDIETNVTVLFVLFDGEEWGVIGSSFLADKFAHSDDSIAVVLNMDEIGYNGGTSSGMWLFYGQNDNYATICRSIAGTLPSIRLGSSLMGSTYYSDHYPFQAGGFNVLFTYGTPQSPYRHTYQDSSTYMNFPYCARIVRAVMATALTADNEYNPATGLTFSYPDGKPTAVNAKTEATFLVQVNGLAGGVPALETGLLHYYIGGASESSVPMADLGEGLYLATIPPLPCNEGNLEYYISVQEEGGAVFCDPIPPAMNVVPVITEVITAFEDDFESDKGWTIFDGLWAIGQPLGLGGQFGSSDPYGGHESDHCLAYNLNGDYADGMPEMNVNSPVIDCSGLSNVHLKFWRWLGVQFYGYDYARVKVSNDGSIYHTVWENSFPPAGGYWIEDDIDISWIAANQSEVYIRYIIGPTDLGWQYCGWNIDDLEVYGSICKTWICGDVNDDAAINILDIIYLINFKYKSGPNPMEMMAADVNSDGNVDILDIVYLINNKYKGGPEPYCP